MPANETELSKYIVTPEASIEEAAQKIEDNGYGTLIVTDKSKVIGTLTDGDIRKAYLTHRLSVIPVREVMNTDFLFVLAGETEKAKAFFSSRFYLRLIPIVDANGCLQSVVKRGELD